MGSPWETLGDSWTSLDFVRSDAKPDASIRAGRGHLSSERQPTRKGKESSNGVREGRGPLDADELTPSGNPGG
jgi:hypothetical protein